MTWEWVVLILGSLTLSLCATEMIFKKKNEPKNATSLLDIEDRLSQIEIEQAGIHQLASDTKKMLSEAHLAKGFRPQR